MAGFLLLAYNYGMAKAVIVYGPPGSGKGTQAELLERNYGFIHFDTGRFIEGLLRSEKANADPILAREKALFDSGKLCTPEWVLSIAKDEAVRIAKAGFDIVFSGSPRTMFEAFGEGKTTGLLETLIGAYGKENIHVVMLKVADETSIKRNSGRLVCSVCGLPKLESVSLPHCALCAGDMRTRSLDSVDVIKVRLTQYRERTFPIVENMKKQGFDVAEVDGEPLPYKVHKEVISVLKLTK